MYIFQILTLVLGASYRGVIVIKFWGLDIHRTTWGESKMVITIPMSLRLLALWGFRGADIVRDPECGSQTH